MSAEPSSIPDMANDTGGVATAPKKTTEKPVEKTSDKSPAAKRPVLARPAEADPASPASERPAAWPTFSPVDVTKYFEDGRRRLRDAFEQANGHLDKARSTAREAGDVLHECHAATLNGLKDLHEHLFDLAQSEVDRTYDCLRSATEARSLGDALQVQSDYLRESMEIGLEQGRTLFDLSIRSLKSVLDPFQSGMSTVIENARKRA